jgi:aspartate racemase
VKTLGIIGGVGPESTIEYYRTIIALYQERKPDGSYPQLIINSIDLKKGMDFMAANNLGGAAAHLLDEIAKLARAGADFGLIAANAPHMVFDDIAPKSAIPLISIVEVTCEAAKRMKLNRLGLFGMRFTMQGDFYPKVFRREGLELVIPEPDDQAYVDDKYMNELVHGIVRPESREGLLAIVDRLKKKSNVEGVILGGTELALILRDATRNGIPLLNTAKLHAEAAIAEMFS